jgi:hypothetical protein
LGIERKTKDIKTTEKKYVGPVRDVSILRLKKKLFENARCTR